jgi:signal transduction histidine kinase
VADPQLIEQVLTNLLTNAMNYTPAGGSVQIATQSVQTNGDRWVTLSVTDTGLGIAPEEQARLFQRFERGQASADLQVPGTGLGLAISKEIIDLHAGRITLESEVDEGSTFTVWLPTDSHLAPAAEIRQVEQEA